MKVALKWGWTVDFFGWFWDGDARALTVQVLWLGGRVTFEGADEAMGDDGTREPKPGHCIFCDEPILKGEPSTTLPTMGLVNGAPRMRPASAHQECIVCNVYGRAACQRGECPACEPPPGQSKRDTAREAFAFWKAAQGRRKSPSEALS
jgi:hypothetical protein